MSNDARRDQSVKTRLVWDVPVRVFHWILVFCFAGAWLTAESERWRQIHVTLGYTMAGLVAFRLVWGFVGTPFARFRNFLRGPRATRLYLTSLVSRKPLHYLGHNPAGAVAILGLLGLILFVAVSGWAVINDIGGNWLEEAHEVGAEALLALVVVHVLGVVISSFLHRENLVRSMLSGYKRDVATAEDASAASHEPASNHSRGTWAILGAVIAAVVIGFWVWQWQTRALPTSDGTTSHINSTETHA